MEQTTHRTQQTITEWLNTFEFQKPIHLSLDGLSLVIPILLQIDKAYFQSLHGLVIYKDESWSACRDKLEIILEKTRNWCLEHLNHPISPTVLNRFIPILPMSSNDEDTLHIVIEFYKIILVMAVQSPNNDYFIQNIQTLHPEYQKEIMLLIEDVMSSSTLTEVTEEGDMNVKSSNQEVPLQSQLMELQLEKQKMELEKKNQELIEMLNAFHDNKSSCTPSLARLKDENQDLELKLDEALVKCASQSDVIQDLGRQLQEFHSDSSKQEIQRLKDELQEYKFQAEKSSSLQIALDKSKKKIQELDFFKSRCKELESLVSEKDMELSQQLQEIRKNSIPKKYLEKYKDQIADLEIQNSKLKVENANAAQQIEGLEEQIKLVESDKENDKQLLSCLRIEIEELKNKEISDTNKSESTLDSVVSADKKTNELQETIKQLRDELQVAKEHICYLENDLDDMERLKKAFEQQCIQSHKTSILVQTENQTLKARIESLLHSNTAEIESHLKASLEEMEKAQELYQQQEKTMEYIKNHSKEMEECNRNQLSHINKLNQEKQVLIEEKYGLQEKIKSLEHSVSQVKMTTAVQEVSRNDSQETIVKLGAATQKLVALTEQNGKLHVALKKAKDHILMQDDMIKKTNTLNNQSNDNYSEAIQSFQVSISEKDAEIQALVHQLNLLKSSTQKEFKLMSNAFHELGSRIQS